MIVFYISSHGFGHASRQIEVINALARHRPDVRIIVRSLVPHWFFSTSTRHIVEVVPVETDTGIVQIDSLNLDEDETARRAARFYEDFDARIEAEARWLASAGATAVVADVPPLACAAAARAGLPTIVLANFTWDWIYRGFERFEQQAPNALGVMTTAYATATHALRLPLHGGFDAMADVVLDIPFIARRSTHSRASVRAALGVDPSRPVVLASFGGHSVRMPYEIAAADGRLTIVVTELEWDASGQSATPPHLHSLSRDDMAARHLHYEDLVIAADVVLSKPGYGIVSECIANGTALLYTSRGRMIEYDVFVEDMPRMLRCRYISQEDVFAGRWADGVEALMAQPEAPTRPMTNGADIAAEFILKTAR
jgi:hypothetical protein